MALYTRRYIRYGIRGKTAIVAYFSVFSTVKLPQRIRQFRRVSIIHQVDIVICMNDRQVVCKGTTRTAVQSAFQQNLTKGGVDTLHIVTHQMGLSVILKLEVSRTESRASRFHMYIEFR